jgi:uncharacterized SAM-binding protein YcdF (DUF218 family)
VTPFFWIRWTLRLLALVLLAALVYLVSVAVRVWHTGVSDATPRHADAIVVLGASQYDGRPSEVFATRLSHARDLFLRGVASRIITVGGSIPGDRYSEAGAGQSWLVQHGVPQERILPLAVGRDTLQSVRAVDATFERRGWHSAVLVTDPWHEFRSRAMADAQGIDASTSPTTSGPVATESLGATVHYIARETLGYVYWRVTRNDAVHGTSSTGT